MALTRDYEAFYSEGGWTYDADTERAFLEQRIIAPLGLAPGARLLDFGCGIGLFAGLFHELGFTVTGVDLSAAGIAHAQAHHPGPAFLNLDGDAALARFAPASFDVVYVRGMSWYHYELDGVNKHGVDVPQKTAALFERLVPGGHFILQIKTDFSGRRPEEGVYHLKRDAFVRHFEPHGDIRLVTDWNGVALASDADGERSGAKIIIATQKAG